MPNRQDRGGAILEIARGLHAVGAIDNERMREYEAVVVNRFRDSGDQARSRAERLAYVHARATGALGSEAKAISWLAAPNRALDGRRPIDLLDSDAAAAQLEAVLARIEHGIFG
jgi:putative toxin-antitoxin system antitoxin component (TIGR02293 family)